MGVQHRREGEDGGPASGRERREKGGEGRGGKVVPSFDHCGVWCALLKQRTSMSCEGNEFDNKLCNSSSDGGYLSCCGSLSNENA